MEKYDFKYKLKPGKSLSYKILIKGGVEVASPMGSYENPIEMEMDISQKILSVENEEGVISVVIDKVHSSQPVDESKLPKPGQESIMTMDERGKVRWVEGKSAWQGSEHSMMKFPSYPLEVDESWVQRVEDSSGKPSPFFTRYVFKGLNKKKRRLAEFNTELYCGNPDDPSSHKSGNGFFYFDLDEKWIDSCDNTVEYVISMPFPQDPSQLITTTTRLVIEMNRKS